MKVFFLQLLYDKLTRGVFFSPLSNEKAVYDFTVFNIYYSYSSFFSRALSKELCLVSVKSLKWRWEERKDCGTVCSSGCLDRFKYLPAIPLPIILKGENSWLRY